MNLKDVLIRYRLIGPFVLTVAVTFMLGFIVGFAGVATDAAIDVANATGATIGGVWLLIGAGYEVYAGVQRWRS